MCALFGWLDYKHIVPYKVLKKLTQALANAAEERGTDASGISYVKNNKISIYKRPKPAHKMRFAVPDGTIAVMGHTRLATQGDQTFNFNNHPFLGKVDKEFSFAHNGVLYNDDSLRKSKNLPDTHIETDSYVAVQLIEQQKKLNFSSLKSMAEEVMGNFVFTALDEDNNLYIVKGSNPLTLIHFEKLGLYVYASTDSILFNALKKLGLQNCKHENILIREGDIISINRFGQIETDAFDTGFDSFDRYWYSDDYLLDEENELSILLETCNNFGYSEDDIFELLECGLTCEEIEDYLMMPKCCQKSMLDIIEY